VVISELNTWPVCTPVNASPASFQTQVHDSEPKWCATLFLCGSHPLLHTGLSRRILDHLVRSRKHIGRHRQANSFLRAPRSESKTPCVSPLT